MTRRPTMTILALLSAIVTVATAAPPPGPERTPWSQVAPGEQKMVQDLLGSPDWPFRVFGLLRLDRYDAVDDLVRARLVDDASAVRCLAIHQAARSGVPVTAADLASETSPQVVRTALRYGVDLPDETIERGARRLLRTKSLDELMLGLEIAAASDLADLRDDAAGRAQTLIRNMNDSVAAVVSTRLAAVFHLALPPRTGDEWRAWLAQQGRTLTFPAPHAGPPIISLRPPSVTSQLETDSLGQLLSYLRGLRQRDLDLVIVMDATMSMQPMIDEARAGVDGLIVFLNDLARSMRLAFIAYRDHDNEPVWEGERFTTDVGTIRDFLMRLRISGGRDYPEAVLEGVAACEDLNWNRAAARQIIVVGDAPPHDEDLYKLHSLIQSYRNHDVTLHTVHVPMRRPAAFLAQLTREAAAADRRWVEQYNEDTSEVFGQMAESGGGRTARLDDAAQLVPAVMHFTIEESWWPVFDEFYELYRALGR